MTAMPDERLIYGCVGADRPEAQPFIDEIDGVLHLRRVPEGAGGARPPTAEGMRDWPCWSASE
jgi:hypothetical protein